MKTLLNNVSKNAAVALTIASMGYAGNAISDITGNTPEPVPK